MLDDPGDVSNVGYPSGFLVNSINEGQSATAALNAFREAGGAIRTQTWYRLYGETQAAIAASPAAAALDDYSLPAATDYVQWSMGRGGQYATSVTAIMTDVETGLAMQKQFLYITADPHTPAEAKLAAWQEFGDPDNEATYQQKMQAAVTKNVYQTVPWNQ